MLPKVPWHLHGWVTHRRPLTIAKGQADTQADALAEMALTPLSCNLAHVFGRSSTFVGFVLVFAVGCAIATASNTSAALIAGRVIAGAGHGGIYTLPEVRLMQLHRR